MGPGVGAASVEASPSLDPLRIGVDEQAVEAEVEGEVRAVARADAVAGTDVDETAAIEAGGGEQEEDDPVLVDLREDPEPGLGHRRERPARRDRRPVVAEELPEGRLRRWRGRRCELEAAVDEVAERPPDGARDRVPDPAHRLPGRSRPRRRSGARTTLSRLRRPRSGAVMRRT